MNWPVSLPLLQKFRTDHTGNVALVFALLTPVMFVAVGSAVDYSVAASKKSAFQNAADAGALAGAKELTLGATNSAYAAEVAKLVTQNNLKNVGSDVSIAAAVSFDKSGISVTVGQKIDGLFSKLVSASPTDIQVSSTATSSSAAQKVCVVGLEEKGGGIIELKNNAKLTANECAVFSNSNSNDGLGAQDNSLLKAQLICSAGGRSGGSQNYAPAPMTDCPVIKDPLISRPAPAVGPCNYTDLVIKDAFCRPNSLCSRCVRNVLPQSGRARIVCDLTD